MAEMVTKYKSANGKEFPTAEEADDWDAYQEFLKKLKVLISPKYSAGYDGPRPVREPTVEDVWRHRKELISLLS